MTKRQAFAYRSGTFAVAMFKTFCWRSQQHADDVCAKRTASNVACAAIISNYGGYVNMGWSGLERNKLDFILSDLLPVELSELFSYTSFYSFLLEKEQQRVLASMVEIVKAKKAQSNEIMFQKAWATKPLKYNIMKGRKAVREMSVVQPFSAINLYLFIEC